MNAWETLQKSMKCLGPRLTRRFGKKPSPNVPDEHLPWPILRNKVTIDYQVDGYKYNLVFCSFSLKEV